MKKVRVMTASGKVLDWAVAKCVGVDTASFINMHQCDHFHFSTDWSEGGPLLFEHKIGTSTEHGSRGVSEWMASTYSKDFDSRIITFGDDPLIAGMRCLVESILGEVVEVPDELV